MRSLSDEPAEQAVRKAIIASAETIGDGDSQIGQQKQPPIPIAELPPKKTVVVLDNKEEKESIDSVKDGDLDKLKIAD